MSDVCSTASTSVSARTVTAAAPMTTRSALSAIWLMRATNLSTEKRSASSRVGRVTAKATVDRDQCTTSRRSGRRWSCRAKLEPSLDTA